MSRRLCAEGDDTPMEQRRSYPRELSLVYRELISEYALVVFLPGVHLGHQLRMERDHRFAVKHRGDVQVLEATSAARIPAGFPPTCTYIA